MAVSVARAARAASGAAAKRAARGQNRRARFAAPAGNNQEMAVCSFVGVGRARPQQVGGVGTLDHAAAWSDVTQRLGNETDIRNFQFTT